MDVPSYALNNFWAGALVILSFVVGVGVGHMIRRGLRLRQYSWRLKSIHAISLFFVASAMGPLVVCQIHNPWALFQPLGLVAEQGAILELGVSWLMVRGLAKPQ